MASTVPVVGLGREQVVEVKHRFSASLSAKELDEVQ